MLIGIDGNEANVENKVGVSEFAFELLNRFSQIKREDSKIQVYLKDKPNSDLPLESNTWKYRVFRPKKLWTQWRLPLELYLARPRPSVFFTPSHYAPRFSPIPTVVSVMDLSYLHFPELFNKSDLYQLINWTKYSVKKAKAVITISNSSRFDIIKAYDLPEAKVHVIYPGIKDIIDLEPHIYPMNELSTKYQITDEYILFVGTLQPRKNIKRLIEAFSKLISEPKHKNIQLIIVGKKGWQYEDILAAPDEFNIPTQVKFLDYVHDEDLPQLYKNAICYVLPSLYEGFGLPILEAMQYDCPVITSNISSMPEAGGDAALYVNPTDTDDIMKKMKKLVESKELRKELIKKGRAQVNKFSWEKAAKEVLTILTSVAKN